MGNPVSESARITTFSYVFVALVFLVLGASFLASTASVIVEFSGTELLSILSANSYLFVFFPTLGIVALAAFYIPAAIFTDIYIVHATLGVFRLALGTIAAVALAIFFAGHLDQTKLRGVWEASPEALVADLKRPQTCLDGSRLCVKPVLSVIADLRTRSLERIRISPFIRDCTPDGLMERDRDRDAIRHCFPAGDKLNADQCCQVKRAFAQKVFGLWANPATRSRAAALDLVLLPFKAFFVIVIIIIGVLLIAWKETLKDYYGRYLTAMERGLQIGAAAMLFWPVMDYAYQQTSDVLYGPSPGFPLRLSLVILPWALLLSIYFADKVRIELTRLVQMIGYGLSGIAILRYQDISDWSSKLVGLGASEFNFASLIALSAIMIVLLMLWQRRSLQVGDEGDPDDGSLPLT